MSKYLPHHRDEIETCQDKDGIASGLLHTLIIVGIIYALAVFGVEAWFTEAQNQERYYSKPVTVTYEKPAAYRLQSPTAEQMDKLHDMQRVAEVNR